MNIIDENISINTKTKYLFNEIKKHITGQCKIEVGKFINAILECNINFCYIQNKGFLKIENALIPVQLIYSHEMGYVCNLIQLDTGKVIKL
jgi:hypothetical protein